MKRIIARLYILIISVLILFGLIYLLNQVIVSRKDYINQSIKVSEETKAILETNWFKHKNFENQGLSDSLKSFMNANPNIHSIIIYSKDKGLIKFNSRYNDRVFLLNSLIPNDPTWNMRPEYSFNWWENYNNNIISTPIQITERGYAFDLIYNVLSTEKVESVFKDAFLIVLIFLILTIIVIIIFSVWKSKHTVTEYDDNSFESSHISKNEKDQVSFDDSFDEDEFDSSDSMDIIDSEDVSESDSYLDEVDSITSDDNMDELDDFSFDDADDDESFNIDNDISSDLTDDFDMDFGDDDSVAELDEIGMDTADELDDFILDTDGTDDTDDTLEELDDFSLDIEDSDDSSDDIEDFSLDMDKTDEADDTLEELDDFSLDIEDSDDIDDFSLDIDETDEANDTLEELDDFSLDIEDTDDSADDLDDFSLDTDETDDTLEELDDFSLDIEDEADDTLEELDDFSLDIEDEVDDLEDLTDNSLDELDDFNLDLDESIEDSELEDDTESLGSLDESIDDDEDNSENESSYDLDDFALDDGTTTDGYNLDDFSLDANDLSSDDLSDLDDFSLEEELELTPEVIEAASDINDLPEFDIEEEELLSEELASTDVKIKKNTDIAPDLSSLLEKAGVSESDLSVVIINLKSDDLQKQYDLIKNHFDDSVDLYEIKKDQIAVAMKDTASPDAITDINKLIAQSKAMNLPLTVGISSMSNRRVGENRLLGEAVKAAEVAEEQSKDMLAFKPDPKKYKDFIINS